MSRPLIPVLADDSAAVLAALRQALAGGPALLPVDSALIPSGAAVPATTQVADDVAVVIHTSGSTDRPKEVALSSAALVAAATSSAERIDTGHWLLALPSHYIAGLQVLVRSLVAGLEPTLLPAGHVSATAFAAAVSAMPEGPRYTSLVPTQLAAILDDPAAAAALAGFAAVLVGGQALPDVLRFRAEAAGVRVVATYGSSETAGGCVYDGSPLPGTAVRVVDGLLELSAPGLAQGYLGAADDAVSATRSLDDSRTALAFREADGRRWYRSQDRGIVAADGTVTVLGRADDVIITGGIKVALNEVQRIVRLEPGAESALLLPVESERWGQASVVVTVGDGGSALLSAVRNRVQAAAGAPARPVAVVGVAEIPLLSSGKPDRLRLIALAQRAADSADS